MNQCKATDGGFSICELEAGHTCRHRDGDYTWTDEAVTAARVRARQQTAPQTKTSVKEELREKIQEIVARECSMYSDSRIEPQRCAGAAMQILWLFEKQSSK